VWVGEFGSFYPRTSSAKDYLERAAFRMLISYIRLGYPKPCSSSSAPSSSAPCLRFTSELQACTVLSCVTTWNGPHFECSSPTSARLGLLLLRPMLENEQYCTESRDYLYGNIGISRVCFTWPYCAYGVGCSSFCFAWCALRRLFLGQGLVDARVLGPRLQGHGGVLTDDWKTVDRMKLKLLRPIMHPGFGPSAGSEFRGLSDE